MMIRLAGWQPPHRVAVALPHRFAGAVVTYVGDLATRRFDQRGHLLARNTVHRHRRRPAESERADPSPNGTRDEAAHPVAHCRRQMRELLEDEDSVWSQ